MNEKYAKLAQGIVYSSIWEEDGDTCKVWVTLLALKDPFTGIVYQNITGIARLAKLPLEKVDEAFRKFQEPDPHSSTDEFEGRRLKRVPEGWLVLNHSKYTELGWSDEKKEYERARKAAYRKRIDEEKAKKEGDPSVPRGTTGVEQDNGFHPDARTILRALNKKSGRDYREIKSNLSIISARLSEKGVETEGVLKMIDRQCQKWTGDPRMSDYLRPETLFGKQKFDNYYAARDLPVQPVQQNLPIHGNNGKTPYGPANPVPGSQPNNGL